MLNKITQPTNPSNSKTSVVANKPTLPNLDDIKNEIAIARGYLDIGEHLARIPTKSMFDFPIQEHIELRRQILSAANEKLADGSITKLYLQKSALSDEDLSLLSNLSNSNNVKYLNISGNEITKIPDAVFTMPALTGIKYEPNEKLTLPLSQQRRLSKHLQINLQRSKQLSITVETQLSKTCLRRQNTTSSAIQTKVQSAHPAQQIDLKHNEKMAALTVQIERDFIDFDRSCLKIREVQRNFKQFIELIDKINDSLLKGTASDQIIEGCKALVTQKVISSIMNIHGKFTHRRFCDILFELTIDDAILPILFIAYLSSEKRELSQFVLKIDFARFKKPLQDKLGNKTFAECLMFIKKYAQFFGQIYLKNELRFGDGAGGSLLRKYEGATALNEFKNSLSDDELASCRIKFFLLLLCQHLLNIPLGQGIWSRLLESFEFPASIIEFTNLAKQILASFPEAGPIRA